MPAVVGPATSRRTPASTAAIGGPTNVVRNNGFRIVRFTVFMALMAVWGATFWTPGTTEFEYARKTPDTAAVSTSDTTATIDARTDTATSVDRVAGIVPDRVVPAQTLPRGLSAVEGQSCGVQSSRRTLLTVCTCLRIAAAAAFGSPARMASAILRCWASERGGRSGWRSDSLRLSVICSAMERMNSASRLL